MKIADFGTARKLAISMTAQTGTFTYMAPEVLISQNYTKSCDIYSFGITLWEMLTRTKPYKNMNNVSIGMNVIREENPLRPSLDEVKEQKWKPILARQSSSDIFFLYNFVCVLAVGMLIF